VRRKAVILIAVGAAMFVGFGFAGLGFLGIVGWPSALAGCSGMGARLCGGTNARPQAASVGGPRRITVSVYHDTAR